MFSALLSIENFSFGDSKKILKFNESIDFNENDENEKREECSLTLCKTNNKNNLSNHFVK